MACLNEPAVERWQELSDLRRIIEAHRAAAIAWSDAFDTEEREALREGKSAPADLDGATRYERETLQRLLTWRPSTLRGEAERLRYLLCDPVGPWKGTPPDSVEVALLLASMEGA